MEDRRIEDRELLPCAFCGGKPMEFVKDSDIIIKCTSDAENPARSGCGAQIRRTLVPPAEWWKAVYSCRDAWNRIKKD